MANQKQQLIERFTVSFYEESSSDRILLEALNQNCSISRFRGNKIKEWAYAYLKSNPDILKELVQNMNETTLTTSENKTKKEAQAEKLKNQLNIVTAK